MIRSKPPTPEWNNNYDAIFNRKCSHGHILKRDETTKAYYCEICIKEISDSMVRQKKEEV